MREQLLETSIQRHNLLYIVQFILLLLLQGRVVSHETQPQHVQGVDVLHVVVGYVGYYEGVGGVEHFDGGLGDGGGAGLLGEVVVLETCADYVQELLEGLGDAADCQLLPTLRLDHRINTINNLLPNPVNQRVDIGELEQLIGELDQWPHEGGGRGELFILEQLQQVDDTGGEVFEREQVGLVLSQDLFHGQC